MQNCIAAPYDEQSMMWVKSAKDYMDDLSDIQ